MGPQTKAASEKRSFFTINRFVKVLLVMVVVVAVAMPLLHYFYIYPLFTRELQKSSEDLSIQYASHLMRTLFADEQNHTIFLTDDIRRELHNVAKDLSLVKIKIFSDSGEVIFSTSEEDIGTVNTHDYFQQFVKQGRPLSNVAQKQTKTLDGNMTTRDVLETYVPIMHNRKFVGAFEIYYDITAEKHSLDQLISKIAAQLFFISMLLIITIVLVFLRLETMLKERQGMEEELKIFANTDPLTQVYNRRRFLEYLEDEISRFIRYNRPASLLMFDIDHFKNVNDTHGHQAGDMVLREVARTCKDILRDTDIIGRYGGEEFVVFLLETDKHHALQVAEKLRQTVEKLVIHQNGEAISVTISIGIALFEITNDLNRDVLINRADKALYEAKDSGRNRIVCYQTDD
ncbi:MAG: GGDEF domain-containing protein [Desulforhopalus sp.]